MSSSPPSGFSVRRATVDPENPTGATRLCERVGTHAAFEVVTHGKALR